MRRILVEQAELLKKVTGDPAHNGSWFEHSDLINGGTLLLQTGPRPNKAWGSRPEAAPPSLSQ